MDERLAVIMSPPGPARAAPNSQLSGLGEEEQQGPRAPEPTTPTRRIPGRTAPGEFELSSLFALVIRLPMLCGLLMAPCLALWTLVLERRTMGNALATDGGKLHLSVTHTSLDCRPNAWMISVAAG